MKNIVQSFLLVFLSGQTFAQNPLQIFCSSGSTLVCDYTPNDSSLWNESYWHDPVNNVQNLSEGPSDLSITVMDTCAITSIRYLLFLDLDQDSILETVVDSDNLPGFNNVQFGNAFNQNYSGGTSSAFDERPVGADLKYGFTLQSSTAGNTTTVHLAWNTMQSPGTYVVPELPYGHHKIKWMVTDACGNESTCEYQIIVKDCKAPTVVCINGLSVNIMPTTLITLWATGFLQYADDNSSRVDLLKFGIRKSGTGTGFPLDSLGNPLSSVTYDCSELGFNQIELWGVDFAGNADLCETYVLIKDDNGYCPSQQPVQLTTCVNFWKDGSPINAQVNYAIDGLPVLLPSSFDSLGCQVVTWNDTTAGNLGINFQLNNDPLNGLNALDLIRMRYVILGLEPFNSPFSAIAADANKSGSITTLDVLFLRNILLGIDTAFVGGYSWRFVDANFEFPNPANPFQTAFPEMATLDPQDSIRHFNFIGIKIGDVDGSAYPGLVAPPEDRTTTLVTLPNATLQPGETIDLPLRFTENQSCLGLQLALQFDPTQLQIENVSAENLPGWDENAWAQPQPGMLRVVWFDVAPHIFQPEESVLTMRVRALAPVRLREALRLATTGLTSAITAGSVLQPLQLSFGTSVINTTTVFAPQPNPTPGIDVQIPLHLAQTETIRLQLVDLTGRLLLHSEQTLVAGDHQLTLPATIFPQSGVYGWRVEAGSVVASGKVVKL